MRNFLLPFSGDPYAKARGRMVREQLRSRALQDERVLHAMGCVPREEFVGAAYRKNAYDDGPLPIGHGQTISQPFTVAFMAEAMQLKATDRVLEVGAGSGYAAAVLAQLVDEVHTIERLESLAEQAREKLARVGAENVRVHQADGTLGLPEFAPYDAIVVAAGGKNKPPLPLVEQLAEGGRLVIPIGDSPRSQTMQRFTRRGDELVSENLGAFAFVPLIGKHGWEDGR